MKKSTKHLFFPVLLHAPLEVRGVYLNSNFPFSFIPMEKFLPTFFSATRLIMKRLVIFMGNFDTDYRIKQ